MSNGQYGIVYVCTCLFEMLIFLIPRGVFTVSGSSVASQH